MHNHEAVDPSPCRMNQLTKNSAALVTMFNFTYTKHTHPNQKKKKKNHYIARDMAIVLKQIRIITRETRLIVSILTMMP